VAKPVASRAPRRSPASYSWALQAMVVPPPCAECPAGGGGAAELGMTTPSACRLSGKPTRPARGPSPRRPDGRTP